MSVLRPQNLDDAVSGVGLAAAVANVIMQLSVPEVGYGVVESPVKSGQAVLHPVKRARTTFTYLAVALWGDEAEKKRYRTAVNGVHAQVRSTETSPVEYNAFDPELQLWVAACLYRGMEDVHRAMYPNAGFRGENGLYEASHNLATTLQVKRSMWPENREEFEVYWTNGLKRVSIDQTVRKYLTDLVDMVFLPAPVRFGLAPVQRFLTTGFLSEEFRDEMHFSWTTADQSRFDALMGAIGVTNRFSPKIIRHFPFNLSLADFRRRSKAGADLV